MDRFIFTTARPDGDRMPERPSALPAVMVPAMSYVPTQFYDNLLELEEGFDCGSVFPELIKPFTGCEPR